MERKLLNPQLSLALNGDRASQFHPTVVETRARRSPSLIRDALLLDQEDALAAGEVGFLARALVQATLPHSDPKTNEFVRRNGHFTLSILAPKDVGLPYGRYPRLVLAYLNTEAVRWKSRDIELGPPLLALLRDPGHPSHHRPARLAPDAQRADAAALRVDLPVRVPR